MRSARAIGNLTGEKMMDRPSSRFLRIAAAAGPVALRNANHWMRGGSYGWQAAEKAISAFADQPYRRRAAVGAKERRIGYQSADRRHPAYADHDGGDGYVA